MGLAAGAGAGADGFTSSLRAFMRRSEPLLR